MDSASVATPLFDGEEFGKARSPERTTASAPPAGAMPTKAERAERDAD